MNYMEQVAKILGVKLNEEFNIEDSDYKYKITKDGMKWYCELGDYWNSANYTLGDILSGIRKIKKPILDEKEKEYLSYVIKPFKDRVNYINKKKSGCNREYLLMSIKLDDDYNEYPSLPSFEKGVMYKGMEINKKYSLEELGL